MDLSPVSEPNTTEKLLTVNETAPPLLRRSTRISVPPKRYGQDENTSRKECSDLNLNLDGT